MKYALVNPNWTFDGSIYFGCREPHLPLEYGYSKALLERAGHEVLLVDAQLQDLDPVDVQRQVSDFSPDFTVVCTAPSYLFWRCAPPELRVPQETMRLLRSSGTCLVGVGPHCSTTPRAALRKLGADVVIMGECEEVLPKLAGDWKTIMGICHPQGGVPWIQGGTQAADMAALPSLRWPAEVLERHKHHHHRFDAQPSGPGAEVETSRGCPYHCTFCAKDNFRDKYRKRPVATVLDEIDALLEHRVEYVYFIDEIFLVNRDLLEALAERRVKFGIQTRLDLWKEADIELLGRAGCVSIEAGVESITPEGRDLLDKKCRMTTGELAGRLLFAKRHVPFVQANLIEMEQDSAEDVAAFRQHLITNGVWANEPVPLFPYPGSPDYTNRWGAPDDRAWERASDYYLAIYREFSDIQDARPRPLHELELAHPARA
ncbi:MAG TPA: TIGR04295 family B12-binding domain-containing radical SAM protein [Bryobacteraceae bacterium]|nr:TIGR04295 family B12-binding domain-containing radical SAM protein [Bryobacteraceae bacterium]